MPPVIYVLNQCRNGGGLVKLRIVSRQFTINVIKRVVFNKRFFKKGMDDGGPENEDEEHVNALRKIIQHIHSFSVSDFLSWLSILDLDGHAKQVKQALEIVRKYHDTEIEKRVLMFDKGLTKDGEEEDFLDVLVKLKDENGKSMLNFQEIQALIIDLMAATADNPSNVVEWALAEMINQPEILEKATKELDNIVGKERLVEESDLPRLNYIKSCIKESFRLHPVAPFNVPHLSTKDTTVSGYFIPKGSRILLSRLGIGRNPRVWDEPMKFKPERHMKIVEEKEVENININDMELNAFSLSIGRRGCPGVTIGSTMVILLLDRLIQGFNWKIPPRVTNNDLLIECRNDLHLKNPLVAFGKPRLANNLYLKILGVG